MLSVAACGGSPTPSASPSAPASSSTTPAPSSSDDSLQSPDQDTLEIAKGHLATVVTNDLRVRTKPSTASDSTKLKPLLGKGTLVYVVSGPTKGSGYTWYRVQPFGQGIDGGPLPFGYIAAASKDGEPWIEPGGPPCPGIPGDYDSLTHTLDQPLLALSCFGGKPITIDARLEQPEATCGVDLGWTVEPEWLGSTCAHPEVLVADTDSTNSIFPVIDPKVSLKALKPGVDEADWIPVTVTGRFDHPAAKTCKGVSSETKVPYVRAKLVLDCRATFVITKIVKR